MFLAQTQSQQQIISASMQQSLRVLQLPLNGLQDYLTELLLENPLVDLNELNPNFSERFSSDSWSAPSPRRSADSDLDQDQMLQNTPDAAQEETFVSHLKQQLPQISQYLPKRYLPICEFLIESLDRRGYLDDPIDLLAPICGVTSEDMMQALYAVQSLSPTGVAARSLEECLMLQLAEGPHFNRCTLTIIRHHLEQLARKDFSAIAKELDITRAEVEQYYHVIRALNPIPSNGFQSNGSDVHYIIPEAYVEVQGNSVTVQYNRTAGPVLSINQDYRVLYEQTEDSKTKEYLSKQYTQVKKLQSDLDRREDTILRVIRHILQVQHDFILKRIPAPLPLAVQDLADVLEMNPSTISRAIKDKYISISGQIVPLKHLLSAQIGKGIPVSRMMLKFCMTKLIDAEDKAHPLSDQSLTDALQTMGISLSRRTTAQYRDEFEIPPASQRRIR